MITRLSRSKVLPGYPSRQRETHVGVSFVMLADVGFYMATSFR